MKGQCSCGKRVDIDIQIIAAEMSAFMVLHFNHTLTYSSTVLLKDALNGPEGPSCVNTESSEGQEDIFSSEWLLYLLQVIELHGYLPEEEVDVRSPLHSADKIRLYVVREREREEGEKV